ncbi:MAG: hypothetical protein KF819_34765 [Labilithrix sp.]|nr:hypothetical protein [Labilithrix sp.]
MSAPVRVRLALAIIAACATSVALYAIIRVAQALLFQEADPALVIWSAHAGFFWRAWTAAYFGAMVGFVAWIAASRDPGRLASILARAVPVAAVLGAAQGLLVP